MNLVCKLLASPWFWLDIVLSVIGGVIVYWGLLVEKKAEKLLPPEDFKPDIFADVIKAQKREVDRGWRILMTGIVLEVVAAFGVSIISGLEIADLKDKTSSANLEAKQAQKEAGESKLLAAQIGTTNAQLVASNLEVAKIVEELRKKNDDLEAQSMPRMFELSRAADQLSKFSGTKVAVISATGSDCVSFASQISEMLQNSKWEVSFISTPKAVPVGVSVGLCDATNEMHVGNIWAEWAGRPSSSHAACVALADELYSASIAIKIDREMWFDTTLRFNGVVVFVGSRPSLPESEILNAEYKAEMLDREREKVDGAKSALLRTGQTGNEYSKLDALANKLGNESDSARKQMFELQRKYFIRLFPTNSVGGRGGRYSAGFGPLP